jgi:hypothetical protein
MRELDCAAVTATVSDPVPFGLDYFLQTHYTCFPRKSRRKILENKGIGRGGSRAEGRDVRTGVQALV